MNIDEKSTLSRLFPKHKDEWLEQVWTYAEQMSERLTQGKLIYRLLPWLLSGCHPTAALLRDKGWTVRVGYRVGVLADEVNRSHRIDPMRSHVRVYPFSVSLHYPFHKQRVLGMVVAVKLCGEEFLIPKESIASIVHSVVPSLQLSEEMVLSYRDPISSAQAFYFEFKKEGNQWINAHERCRLIRELPSRIAHGIQPNVPPVFMPHNEEETLKGIVTLGQEIEKASDRPQLILNFQQIESRWVIFTGILVRVRCSGSIAMETLIEGLPNDITWKTDAISVIGTVENEEKESISFSCSLEHQRFTRADGAVDLRRARQFACQTLQRLFGAIRDYNGGWMSLQAETLEATKALLSIDEKEGASLLEKLFYSLRPRVVQSYLHPAVLHQAFLLLKKEISLLQNRSGDGRLATDKGEVVTLVGEKGSLPFGLEEQIAAYYPGIAFASFSHQDMDMGAVINLHLSQEKMGKCTNLIKQAIQDWEVSRNSRQVVKLSMKRLGPSLDPRLGTDRRSGPLLRLIYEGLMKLDPNGHPVPACAQTVDVSLDRLHYRFGLRNSVWSNGEPLTAYDFEYGWKKTLSPDVTIPFIHLFYPIKGARHAKRGNLPIDQVGIHALDDKTLLVELAHPTPHFLAYTTFWSFAPLYRNIDHQSPAWAFQFKQGFPSNGPFMPVTMSDQALELVKNPQYWDADSTQLDRIDILLPESPEENLSLWEKGHLDWVGAPLYPLPVTNRGQRPQREQAPTAAVCCLHLNTLEEPFSDQRNRQSVAANLYQDPLLNGVFPEGAVPTQRYVSPVLDLGTKPPKHRTPPKSLPATIRLVYPAVDDLEGICQAIAKRLQATHNLRVVVEGVSWESYWVRGLSQIDAHLGVSIWYPFCADPICYLDRFADLTAANTPMWQSQAFNHLLDKANRASTMTERTDYLRQAEELLLMEAPLIPLYFHTYLYAKKARLRGSILNSLGIMNLKNIYVETK